MEPQDPGAAQAAGGGHLRAGDADRERVIGFLKDAYVQCRLSKSELTRRTGQALQSRTYTELVDVTAGIPAGRASAPPSRQAAPDDASPVRWDIITRVLGVTVVLPGLGVAFFATYYGSFFVLLLIGFVAAAVIRMPERPGAL
jgi:hypothetical protein